MIITVTPNPAVDRTLTITGLVRGAVHRAIEQHDEPSGKGVNVARALSGNGVDVLALLPLDREGGRAVAAMLDEEQVRFRSIEIAGAIRMNISLTAPDGETTKINAPSPRLTFTETGELTDLVRAHVRPGDWVVGSGSLPNGVPSTYYEVLAGVAHSAQARFALDSSGAALLAGLAGRPDVIKPNMQELRDAVGRPISTVGDAVSAARELLAAGAGTVVVSLGPDGALLVSAAQVWHAVGGSVVPISTIGAGDALLAGYLAATRSGPDDGTGRALHEAVAWGTAAVSAPGSQVPPVTAQHRAAVSLTSQPDLSRRLTEADRG